MQKGDNKPATFEIHLESEPFWTALREGNLMIKWCHSCGEAHFYPRPHCPLCGYKETIWKISSGEATVYSFAPIKKENNRFIAIVSLDDGPMLTTLIIGNEKSSVCIGDRVKFSPIRNDDNQMLPAFSFVKSN